MQVTVNGAPAEVQEATSVAALVAAREGGEHRRVAVALNGAVVPRSRWETTRLTPGDSIEVLAPTAGG
ncbi:sulfur carrier protein [Blastococcus colisei]|uniref:Sulfur carrier protein n=1 Tax=Blastococcus colisei TaxID=1564162 RepID=A0A543PK20_9ACTN|nr:sulfur carrier protein ThiS [Blastococcus colisei]TQN44430.1 sulfur carrier protein [Blastococcus colisei]